MTKRLTTGLLAAAIAAVAAFVPSADAAMLPPDLAAASSERCSLEQVCAELSECEGMEGCQVTVEPGAEGTCVITCTDERGATRTCVVECEETECEGVPPCANGAATCESGTAPACAKR